MSDALLSYGVSSYVTQGVLIVPFQADFYQEVMAIIQKDILKKLQAQAGLKGLIIDLSQVELMDLSNMQTLEKIAGAAGILGASAFLTGMQPATTMALVELGYEAGHLKTALTVEDALEKIHACVQSDMDDFTWDAGGDEEEAEAEEELHAGDGHQEKYSIDCSGGVQDAKRVAGMVCLSEKGVSGDGE